MREHMESAGLRVTAWDEVTPPRPPSVATPPAGTIQRLVMGDDDLAAITRAARVNEAERRLVLIHAIGVAETKPIC
jgi:hypothetical protein